MPRSRAERLLRIDGALTLALGALVLLSVWNGLYEALDLPRPLPALGAQFAGASMLGLGYVLWNAAMTSATPILLRGAALANGLAALILILWLAGRWEALSEDWQVDGVGKTLIALVALARLVLGALELAALRSERTTSSR